VAWLVLAYRLPVNHGLKMTVRRRLTAMGAVFPVNAVAAVPTSPAAERAFRRIRRIIREAGGSAQVLRAEAIEGAPDLVTAFNAAREQEYAEILAGCGELIAGVEALATAGRYRYPDLGDKDAELRRLSMRTDTIRTRDALGAANAEDAVSALARCRAALEDFASRVYQTDSAPITGIVSGRRSPER
jgi:Protein ChrB, N-terminal